MLQELATERYPAADFYELSGRPHVQPATMHHAPCTMHHAIECNPERRRKPPLAPCR